MKVYVLWGLAKIYDVEHMSEYVSYIIGIFSNKQKAEERMKKEKNADVIEEFEVIEE